MQNNISYNARITLNKNKIVIMKNNQNLREVLSKFIKIDNKYDKILREIGKNINKKKVEHIDIMLNMPVFGAIMIKIFVIGNDLVATDYRELGMQIHNYTIANGITEFDLISETDGERLFNTLEGILIMNYKFTEFAKEKGSEPFINYKISLIGRGLKERELMNKHLKILEQMMYSVGNQIKNMPKSSQTCGK